MVEFSFHSCYFNGLIGLIELLDSIVALGEFLLDSCSGWHWLVMASTAIVSMAYPHVVSC